jgi:hypothetical protein
MALQPIRLFARDFIRGCCHYAAAAVTMLLLLLLLLLEH